MIKYRIEIATNYKNPEGKYRKSVFETEYYTVAINKFNELKDATTKDHEMTYNTTDLYNHDTNTYKHYFTIEMVSQHYEHGDWRGLSNVIKGGLEKYIGNYKF